MASTADSDSGSRCERVNPPRMPQKGGIPEARLPTVAESHSHY